MQEKEKYEHIRQAKEKAIEEQRISEENKRRVEAEKQAESDRISREHDKTTEQPDTERTQEVSDENENEGGVPNTATSDTIGSDWSSVSPEIAANYMASKTGVVLVNGLMLFIRSRVETLMLKIRLDVMDFFKLTKIHMEMFLG